MPWTEQGDEMSTRVIRIGEHDAFQPHRVRGPLDPAGTALMLAVSGAVLAASLLLASLSVAASPGLSVTGGVQPGPAPAPAPTLMASTNPGGR
jgi:hypothetical protein